MSENTDGFNARYSSKDKEADFPLMSLPFDIAPDRPVLIAGPTASGKSALALEIAETQGGVIVNADAIQVYDNWRILTARPSPEDESRAPHALYGHVPRDADYSVGHWLREVAPFLKDGPRPIITGGTGLYFTALTQGLADIPPTPPEICAKADARVAEDGFESLLAELDAATAARNRPPQSDARATCLGGAARHGPPPGRMAGRHAAAPSFPRGLHTDPL